MIVSSLPDLLRYGANSSADDPHIYDGAHVSLQLVGRRLQEEKILAVTEYIGKLIGK